MFHLPECILLKAMLCTLYIHTLSLYTIKSTIKFTKSIMINLLNYLRYILHTMGRCIVHAVVKHLNRPTHKLLHSSYRRTFYI